MNRAQRILKYIVNRKRPASLHDITNAVADCETTARFVTMVAAQLHQLVKTGKLTRYGHPRHYTYAANTRTLVDGRKIDRDGKPRNRTALARAPKPRKPPKPAPKAAKPKPSPRPQTQAQRLIFTKPARPSGIRETVDEFLARGGRIQKLKTGEFSTPLYESVRALNDKTMRKRLVTADNDSDQDDSDDNAAAFDLLATA